LATLQGQTERWRPGRRSDAAPHAATDLRAAIRTRRARVDGWLRSQSDRCGHRRDPAAAGIPDLCPNPPASPKSEP
jgi:hypothetical protein